MQQFLQQNPASLIKSRPFDAEAKATEFDSSCPVCGKELPDEAKSPEFKNYYDTLIDHMRDVHPGVDVKTDYNLTEAKEDFHNDILKEYINYMQNEGRGTKKTYSEWLEENGYSGYMDNVRSGVFESLANEFKPELQGRKIKILSGDHAGRIAEVTSVGIFDDNVTVNIDGNNYYNIPKGDYEVIGESRATEKGETYIFMWRKMDTGMRENMLGQVGLDTGSIMSDANMDWENLPEAHQEALKVKMNELFREVGKEGDPLELGFKHNDPVPKSGINKQLGGVDQAHMYAKGQTKQSLSDLMGDPEGYDWQKGGEKAEEGWDSEEQFAQHWDQQIDSGEGEDWQQEIVQDVGDYMNNYGFMKWAELPQDLKDKLKARAFINESRAKEDITFYDKKGNVVSQHPDEPEWMEGMNPVDKVLSMADPKDHEKVLDLIDKLSKNESYSSITRILAEESDISHDKCPICNFETSWKEGDSWQEDDAEREMDKHIETKHKGDSMLDPYANESADGVRSAINMILEDNMHISEDALISKLQSWDYSESEVREGIRTYFDGESKLSDNTKRLRDSGWKPHKTSDKDKKWLDDHTFQEESEEGRNDPQKPGESEMEYWERLGLISTARIWDEKQGKMVDAKTGKDEWSNESYAREIDDDGMNIWWDTNTGQRKKKLKNAGIPNERIKSEYLDMSNYNGQPEDIKKALKKSLGYEASLTPKEDYDLGMSELDGKIDWEWNKLPMTKRKQLAIDAGVSEEDATSMSRKQDWQSVKFDYYGWTDSIEDYMKTRGIVYESYAKEDKSHYQDIYDSEEQARSYGAVKPVRDENTGKWYWNNEAWKFQNGVEPEEIDFYAESHAKEVVPSAKDYWEEEGWKEAEWQWGLKGYSTNWDELSKEQQDNVTNKFNEMVNEDPTIFESKSKYSLMEAIDTGHGGIAIGQEDGSQTQCLDCKRNGKKFVTNNYDPADKIPKHIQWHKEKEGNDYEPDFGGYSGEAMYGFGSATGRMSPAEHWKQGLDAYGDMGYDSKLGSPMYNNFQGMSWNELPEEIKQAYMAKHDYIDTTQTEALRAIEEYEEPDWRSGKYESDADAEAEYLKKFEDEDKESDESVDDPEDIAILDRLLDNEEKEQAKGDDEEEDIALIAQLLDPEEKANEDRYDEIKKWWNSLTKETRKGIIPNTDDWNYLDDESRTKLRKHVGHEVKHKQWMRAREDVSFGTPEQAKFESLEWLWGITSVDQHRQMLDAEGWGDDNTVGGDIDEFRKDREEQILLPYDQLSINIKGYKPEESIRRLMGVVGVTEAKKKAIEDNLWQSKGIQLNCPVCGADFNSGPDMGDHLIVEHQWEESDFEQFEEGRANEYSRKAEKVCDFCHEEQGTMYKTKTGKDICEYCKGEGKEGYKDSDRKVSPSSYMHFTEPVDVPTGRNILDQTYGTSEPETKEDPQDLTGKSLRRKGSQEYESITEILTENVFDYNEDQIVDNILGGYSLKDEKDAVFDSYYKDIEDQKHREEAERRARDKEYEDKKKKEEDDYRRERSGGGGGNVQYDWGRHNRELHQYGYGRGY